MVANGECCIYESYAAGTLTEALGATIAAKLQVYDGFTVLIDTDTALAATYDTAYFGNTSLRSLKSPDLDGCITWFTRYAWFPFLAAMIKNSRCYIYLQQRVHDRSAYVYPGRDDCGRWLAALELRDRTRVVPHG
jgi:hypothetical protein